MERPNDETEAGKDVPWAVDGMLLKGCDNLAAFIEANSSIKYGVSSKVLSIGKQRLLEIYQDNGTSPA